MNHHLLDDLPDDWANLIGQNWFDLEEFELPPLNEFLSQYPNWPFEPDLRGWEKTGTAFDNQPTYHHNVVMRRGAIPVRMPLKGRYWHKLTYPIGHKGYSWVGTYDARPNSSIPVNTVQGDGPTGTLTAKPFKIVTNFITFLIGGGQDIERLKVELLLLQPDGDFTPVPGSARTGMNSEVFRREWWDVRAYRDQVARIRITDASSASWGHINVDDFCFQDTAPTETTVHIGRLQVPQVVQYYIHPADASSLAYVDYDAPVWGVADLHAHPASHIGFGATFDEDTLEHMGIFWGKPGGALSAAASTIASDLAPCDPMTHGADEDDVINNLIRQSVLTQVNGITGYPHAGSGWPDFRNWPSAYSIQHQQMHITWLRRAYEGGLRLMIASVTDNQTFNLLWHREFDLGHDPIVSDPDYDKPKARQMLNFIKTLASQNSDWLEVVTAPDQARQAIRSGRLALILGLEMDQLSAEDILELREDGVRHVIPIHLADNQHFGGCAVFADVFNSHNFTLNGYWLSVKGDTRLSFRLKRPKFLNGVFAGAAVPVEIGEGEYWALRYNCNPDPGAALPGCIPSHDESGHPLGHRNTNPARPDPFLRLMAEGLMIDLAHMSQDVQDAVLSLSERFAYPLNNSHTSLRDDASGEYERHMPVSYATRMAAQGGVLGLLTGAKPEPVNLVTVRPVPTQNAAHFERESRSWTIACRRPGDDREYNQLSIIVHMGEDDIDEGIPAELVVRLRDGREHLLQLNHGTEWKRNTVHFVPLTVPGDLNLQSIQNITVRGAAPLKNWAMNRLEVRPARVVSLFTEAGTPLHEFDNDRPKLSFPVLLSGAAGDALLRALNVTIQTGEKDLSPTSRLEAVIEFLDRPPLIVTLSEGQRLEENSTNSWAIPIMPPVRAGQINRFSLQVSTSGVALWEKWEVLSLQVLGVTQEGEWLDLSGPTGKPLARLSTNQPERVLYYADSIPEEQAIIRIQFSVKTGEGTWEALRSSSGVYAAVLLRDGRVLNFTLKEPDTIRWWKKSIYAPVFSLPADTYRGSIDAVRITYEPESEISTDEWGVAAFEVNVYYQEEDPVGRWVNSYRTAVNAMDYHGLALGTDMNGFVAQLPFTRDPIAYASGGDPDGLVQHHTGTKAWNFNTDGLAHYGLLPDFFEAISQHSAMTYEELAPLFHSAEEVIQMWENAERAAMIVRALTLAPGIELRVRLQAVNRAFVQAAADESLSLRNTPDSESAVFRLTQVGPQSVALRASNGRFVTVVGGPNQEVRANAATPGSAETFELVPCRGGQVAFRTHDNHFLNLRHTSISEVKLAASGASTVGAALFELVPDN